MLPQKTGEALNFELAISERKIKNDDPERLKQVLRLVMVKIGLRSNNWPGDEEKAILIAHIIENFGGHTVSEIRLAFEMAMAGKLEADANCYENFSCLYFSKIMEAYREWAKEMFRQVKPEKEKKDPDLVNINMDYACYLRKKVSKLPVL